MRRLIDSRDPLQTAALRLAVCMLLLALARQSYCAAPFARYGFSDTSPARFIRTGHEGMPVDTLPVSHITRVVRLPTHNQHAPLYSFFTAYTDFFPDQLRSWRLKVLDGKLAGHTYQISTNGPDSITVTDLYGSLDEIAIGNLVIVESVVERYIPER